jgi:dihydrodipicolinate synthase/N-acetylneuraminate lyase
MTMDPARLSGVHCVLYAYFDRDERLDRAQMRRQVEAVVGAGVAGVTVLGLATEVGKLSAEERKRLMGWTAEDVAGRLPLSITINGHSVAEQIDQVKAAEAAGADWLILQPPAAGTFPAGEYIGFFGRVADAAQKPVAIQNAPAYFGRGLTAAELAQLFEKHPNLRIIKGEGPAVDIAALVETVGAGVPVFNGRGGLEMTDSLRAGCAGLILAPDLVDRAAQCFAAYRDGDEARAEEIYAGSLPGIVFIMQSLETLILYGKRIFALRAGLGEVFDRAPAARPTSFGLATADRLARHYGPFGTPARPLEP